jgi:hypothetical protein
MSGEAWLSGAWLGAQLPHTQPAQTSISLGIANLNTMHRVKNVLKYGVISPTFIWTPVSPTAILIGSDPATPPPAFGLIYDGGIGYSQDRRHLFVTTCHPT